MKQILGDLEEKILQVLWESEGPQKPSDVLDVLGDCGDCYAYTTIMTVMKRLHEKGILTREYNGKAYYYKPAKNKEHFIKPKLKSLFNTLLQSYGDLAISQFVDVLEGINPEELDKLKKYINEKK